jgi:hypothetical protein
MASRKRAKNPLYDGAVKCGCVVDANRRLAEYNTEVVTTLFTGQVALMVQKADSSKRGKAINVLAGFCPFCGVEYPRSTPSESKDSP